MTFEAHKAKYEEHKDFFVNGIKDKAKHSGWYLTVMYFAIYHLTCYYCAKRGQRLPTPENLDSAYDPGCELSLLYKELKFVSNCKTNHLYKCLKVSDGDADYADREVFPKLEQKLLS